MKRYRILQPFLFVMVWPSVSVSALENEIEIPQCPATIKVKQTVKESPQDWEAYGNESARSFMNIYFTNSVDPQQPGKPSYILPKSQERYPRPLEKGERVTEERFLAKRGTIYSYEFPPSKELWVVCDYGGTTRLLARRIPENITHCVVDHEFYPTSTIKTQCFNLQNVTP